MLITTTDSSPNLESQRMRFPAVSSFLISSLFVTIASFEQLERMHHSKRLGRVHRMLVIQ